MTADAADRDVVLFLGAGFSADADLPTMANFGSFSRREHAALRAMKKRKKNSRRWATAPLLKSAGEFRRFQKRLRRALRVAQVDADNLEEAFCIAEILRECEASGSQECPASDVYKAIKIWLWKLFHRCPVAGKGNVSRRPYCSFVADLCGRGILPRLTVVSTNYDLVFEYVIWEYDNALACRYPFSYAPLRLITEDRGAYVRPQDGASDGPLVCKLHGSVNGFECDDTILVADQVANQGDSLDRDTVRHLCREPAIFNVAALRTIQNGCPKAAPAVIPPTYAKLQANDWLKKTWKRAYEALRDAKAIVFIGYSMPESDGFMRAMIQGAMAARESDKPPTIWVVDPSEETHARYARLFRHLDGGVKSVKLGFAEAVTLGKFARIFKEIA